MKSISYLSDYIDDVGQNTKIKNDHSIRASKQTGDMLLLCKFRRFWHFFEPKIYKLFMHYLSVIVAFWRGVKTAKITLDGRIIDD